MSDLPENPDLAYAVASGRLLAQVLRAQGGKCVAFSPEDIAVVLARCGDYENRKLNEMLDDLRGDREPARHNCIFRTAMADLIVWLRSWGEARLYAPALVRFVERHFETARDRGVLQMRTGRSFQ